MSLHIVILAAGMGKRMYSTIPKVLHCLAGKPMLEQVVTTAKTLNPEAIHVIFGHGGEQIQRAMAHLSVNWVFQKDQLGTGHAVLQAMEHIPNHAQVLILSADVPLIKASTLKALIATSEHMHLSLLLAHIERPTGLGRIVRDKNGLIRAIVEEKDANELQKQIKEIYSGICCAPAKDLKRWLPALSNNNAQNEYYLTEIIAMAEKEQHVINSLSAPDIVEIQGVNNRLQLQKLERLWQKRHAESLLLSGVMIADSERFDLQGELHAGMDVFIDINCKLLGKVVLGDNCHIEPNCVLKNVTLGAGTHIFANSVLEESETGENCQIGPFARLRPGTRLADNCKIGNFVETKNAVFGYGSKASHLSYLGDVCLGEKVNIGAGTITCNYDGANKYQTIIEDGAFIGSDTQLIAPVTIGAHATIGAGSTIRKDVPPNELTLTDTKQRTVYGWKRPVKVSTEI